jgi:hypothetical protein
MRLFVFGQAAAFVVACGVGAADSPVVAQDVDDCMSVAG